MPIFETKKTLAQALEELSSEAIINLIRIVGDDYNWRMALTLEVERRLTPVATLKNKKADKPTDNPVFYQPPGNEEIRYAGWYFWDESWSHACGPFKTEAEACRMLKAYAEQLDAPVMNHPDLQD